VEKAKNIIAPILLIISILLLSGIAGNIDHATMFHWEWIPLSFIGIGCLISAVVFSNVEDNE